MRSATSGSVNKALINTAQHHLEMMALMIMKTEGKRKREISVMQSLLSIHSVWSHLIAELYLGYFLRGSEVHTENLVIQIGKINVKFLLFVCFYIKHSNIII